MSATAESQVHSLVNDPGLISKEVAEFLASPKKMFIGGDWVDSSSGQSFDVKDPSSDRVIATVAEGQAEDIDRAVAAARQAFEDSAWSRMKPVDRERLMHKLADLIEEHADTLAEIEALDNGKSVVIARHVDIKLAIEVYRYMAGWPTKLEGQTLPMSGALLPDQTFVGYSLREPIGVVGAIVAWNFPFLLAAWKIAPALAAGCTVVLKPAEETPLSSLYLAKLAAEAGFPEGVLNVVPGFGDTAGAALSSHPDVDKITFTGSTEVGRLIARAATGNLKKVTLELGGKSPTIIFGDVDAEAAIAGAASAIFFNHGQTCCAGSRLYVHSSRFDEIVEGVSAAAAGLKIGPGLDPETELGPLVSTIQRERVMSYVSQGLADGAEAVVGGRALDTEGYYVEPTVFTHTNPEMSIVREEIFGPVVVAAAFDDLDEIAAVANQSTYGLGASIWTKDISTVHRLAPKLRAGTVWVNCHNVLDSTMPFGGYKQSGWGREMGKESVYAYLESKSMCISV